MPKQDSTRTTPTKRIAARKSALGRDCWRKANAALSAKSKADYRELARLKVFAAWPKILEGLIEKAISGGYLQSKLLLDLCDLTDIDPHQLTQQHKQQLCDRLLENLLSPSTKSEKLTKDAIQQEKNSEVK